MQVGRVSGALCIMGKIYSYWYISYLVHNHMMLIFQVFFRLCLRFFVVLSLGKALFDLVNK